MVGSRRRRGYLMVSASYVIGGSIGVLVTGVDAPASMLIVMRMSIAAAVLAVFFARRSTLHELRRPGVMKLLLLLAALDAVGLLLFFVSMRSTSVAIGMFLSFLAPLWVALLAPVFLRQRTERIIWPAIAIAMGGLALILVPPLIGHTVKVSWWGLLFGLLSGVGLAGFMMIVSVLRTKGIRSVTIVLAEGTLDTVILLPLATWQTWVTGSGLTSIDLLAGLILGTVCTALTFVLWAEGVAFIPVQHAPILGYIQPMMAPLYAFLVLGEGPSMWTLLGGLLIVSAGSLVVLKGGRQTAEELAATPEI